MIKFELISPEAIVFSEEIYEAILPSTEGQIAVFPGHIPLITLLRTGIISLRRAKGDPDSKLEHIATTGGFVEISDNSIKVMADSAERADDLDDMKIKEAKEAALRAKAEAKDDVAYTDAIARLEFELAREKVRNLKRSHGQRTTPGSEL